MVVGFIKKNLEWFELGGTHKVRLEDLSSIVYKSSPLLEYSFVIEALFLTLLTYRHKLVFCAQNKAKFPK